jgi:hypothetical protein
MTPSFLLAAQNQKQPVVQPVLTQAQIQAQAAQQVAIEKAMADKKSVSTLLFDIQKSESDLKNLRNSILYNPLVKERTKEIVDRKNPYAHESGVFTITPEDLNPYLKSELKNTQDAGYKNTLRQLKHSVSEYNDKFKESDRLTDDPRYLKVIRQQRVIALDLINDKGEFDIGRYIKRQNDLDPDEQYSPEIEKQINERANSFARSNQDEFNQLKQLAGSVKDEFFEGKIFDKKRLDLEKDLSKHAIADADFLLARDRFDREIRDEANEQDLSQPLEHRQTRHLAIQLDDATRAMRNAQAQVAASGGEYQKENYARLRKEFDIDKMYEDSMNRYKQEHAKEFDKFYVPSLDKDSAKTTLEMKNQAEKASKSVRDLDKSWLSNLKFYTVSSPYYTAKYYGHKLKNALGLNSKIAQDVSDLASKATSAVYGVLPSVSVSLHKNEDKIKEMHERNERDWQITKETELINSIKQKKQITPDDLKILRNLENDLSKPFVVRYKARKLIQDVVSPKNGSTRSSQSILAGLDKMTQTIVGAGEGVASFVQKVSSSTEQSKDVTPIHHENEIEGELIASNDESDDESDGLLPENKENPRQ